jgi:hypothetical protein
MAFEKIKYLTTSVQKPNFTKLCLLWGVVPFLAGWLFLGGGGWGVLVAIAGMIVGILLSGYKIMRAQRKSFSDAKAHFVKQGYQADFELKTLLAIDSKARKIAFIDHIAGSYDLYDFSDILGWEHQWVNKANTVRNVWDGRITYLKDSKTNNMLVFQTKNPHQPLYKFAILGHANGETWMARLNAMMSR